MKKINWGIIGLGAIASKFADGFKYSENATLLGIASNDSNKIKKFKENYNISENYCYDNYDNLINDQEIDIIYIALPTSLHLEWIISSLKAGKRVLVEKPATINSLEAKKIKEQYVGEKTFFTEAFMYLYHPQIKKVLKIIESGEIGDLLLIKSFFGQDILTKRNFLGFKKRKKINPESRLYNKKMGGGAILDLGCYPISFTTIIASLISKVNYDNVQVLNIKKEIGETDVDLESYVELKFENGLKAIIGVSFANDLGKQTKIIGTKGELTIEDTWTANISQIKIKKNNEDKILNINSVENIYSYEIEAISKCILENKSKVDFPGLTIDNTIGNMKIIDKWLY